RTPERLRITRGHTCGPVTGAPRPHAGVALFSSPGTDMVGTGTGPPIAIDTAVQPVLRRRRPGVASPARCHDPLGWFPYPLLQGGLRSEERRVGNERACGAETD